MKIVYSTSREYSPWRALDLNNLSQVMATARPAQAGEERLRSATVDSWYQKFKKPSPWPEDKTLHEIFIEAAKKYPERVAIDDPQHGCQLTYKEVDEQSDLLAKYLRFHGVRFENVVGIYMEHSAEYIIAYIAIHKAGGAYMPLEIAYPDKLMKDVIDDSKPTVVLTKAFCAGRLPSEQLQISMEKGWVEEARNHSDLAEWIDPRDDPAPHPDSLAYVVYSSGTTGKPKGICCPHRGSVMSYSWRHAQYPLQDDDRVAVNVFFVWECFRPLMVGGVVVCIPDEVIYDPVRLVKFLEDQSITRILFTPSLCQACFDAPGLVESHDLSKLKLIHLCGEVVTTDLVNRIRKLLPDISILNLFSISECHDVSCSPLHVVKTESKYAKCGYVFGGNPAGGGNNVEVYVLDEDKKVVPAGEKGHVYVAGCNLAIGYLNQPEMTAKKFIMWQDPKFPDTKPRRMYYTGDSGVMRLDGELEILGRVAFFVKIRGYSVVLGQIEVALLEHPAVKSAVVLAQGAEGEDKHLVAYLVINGGTKRPSKTEIVKHVSDRVPSYSVPPNYVVLETLPISATIGKLDRKKLPPLENVPPTQLLQVEEALQLPPSTATEKAVAELWSKNLEVPVTSSGNNYFFLGGHSLSAGALLRAVKKKFGVKVVVADLYKNPTLKEFAAKIDTFLGGDEKEDEGNLNAPITVDFAKDSVLPADIAPAWEIDSWSQDAAREPSTVLLTGATGFLGAYLLREVLQRTKANVIVMGRAGSTGIQKRVEDNMKYYELGDLDSWGSRVTGVEADLASENLGLSGEKWQELASGCDMIIHCAAAVNLVKPYEELKPTNVDGVVWLLRMACQGISTKFVYISTNGVFRYDGQHHAEDAAKPDPRGLHDGYCQSKSVAEDLVLAAAKTGLPVQVHRVGNLVPDGHHGVWSKTDFFRALFAAGFDVDALPSLPEWNVRLTPVDWAAAAIVGLAHGAFTDQAGLYHIANASTVNFDQVTTWMDANQLAFGEFLSRIRNDETYATDNVVRCQAMLATVEAVSDMEYTRLGHLLSEQTEAALKQAKLSGCPSITQAMVTAWKQGLGVIGDGLADFAAIAADTYRGEGHDPEEMTSVR